MFRTLSLLLAIGLLSCKSPSAERAFNKDVIEAEVSSMLHAYHDAMNTGGLMAEFEFLDNSADFFWVPPGFDSHLNFDSVSTILRKNDLGLQSVRFEWKELKVIPLSNDVANYTGIVGSKMLDTAGIENSMTIIESGTIIRRSDGWKILSGQSAVLE